MSNLKALKIRIASVKSTQKITKAMKMVAASKLRRAQERAQAAAPYAERMARMLSTVASGITSAEGVSPLMVGTGKDKVHLLVVMTSDRGLCGGFNSSLVKKARAAIAHLQGQGKTVKLFCVGKKAYDLLRREHAKLIVKYVDGLSKQKSIGYHDAESLAATVLSLFEAGEFDVCSIFYNRFQSALAQEPTQQQIIPLEVQAQSKEHGGLAAVYEYEPGERAILEDLLPRNIAVQIFHGLLENGASEQGARMTAMDNATRNAGEMIKGLTLKYNRTRQAAITKELIEIISGAEAV